MYGKISKILGLVILLAMLLSACAQATVEPETPAATQPPAAEKKLCEGVTITVGAFGGGPEGVISGVLYKNRADWEARSGGKLEIAEIPYGDMYEKIMADFTTGANLYDGAMGQAWFLGDEIAGDYILPITEYMNDPRFSQVNWSDILPPVDNLLKWGDTYYSTVWDADENILWYRKDILSDPTFAAEFKTKYGYDLPNPPTTVDQLIDASEFFNGQDWNKDGDPDYGISMMLISGQTIAQFSYQLVASGYTIMPGEKIDQYHNVFWFDPVTMEPLINDPGHVKALEKWIDLVKKGGPSSMLSWGLGESWAAFLDGKAVFVLNTADIPSAAQTKPTKGTIGGSPMPGSTEVWDRETNTWKEFNDPVRSGNLLGANWHGTIAKTSKHPECVYDLFAFLSTKEKLMEAAFAGWDGLDPTSSFQFVEPQGTAKVEEYVAANWNADDAKAYSQALYENFEAVDTFIPYLRIRGTNEFLNALDIGITQALAGQKTPQEALDEIAKEWKQTIDSIGKDQLLKEYQISINYGKAPTGP